MAEQYVGNIKRMTSKGGKEYFKGKVGGVPVVGFYGRKNPDQINLKLDVGLIKWIDEQEDKQKPQTRQGNPFNADDDDEPLPF